MTSPNFMVIGLQIRKLHRGGGIRPPPPAVLDSKKPGLFRVKDHTPTHTKKEINFWNAFFFEYNMRKSVGPKCAVSLRHVTNCSRIHTTTTAQVFFRLFPQYYSNTLLFFIVSKRLCGETNMLVFVEASVILTHRLFRP